MKRIVSSSAHISAKASKSSAEGGRRIRRSVTSKGPLSMAILSSAWRRGDASAARGGARQAHTLEDTGGKPVRSEEHTSELQSLMRISYAVFCLKKKKN